jgi:hypothetical protein
MASERGGFGWALAVLALLPGPAWAAGEITGVAANPSTTSVNQPVTVTVTGTGTCSQVVVRCDAPQAADYVKLNVAAWPFSVSCNYGSSGNKTVTASAELPNPDCPGDRITYVEVKPSFKFPPGVQQQLVPPQIQAVWNGGKVRPGGLVLVSGKGFGAQAGNLQIKGQFGTRNLQIEQWVPTYVLGRMPDVCGVPDHATQLAVLTAGGAKSNDHPASFLARHELRELTMSDVQVVQCSDEGNVNHCNHVYEPGDWHYPTETTLDHLNVVPGSAVWGSHFNCWGCLGDDQGVDTYRVNLKNGWKLAGAVFEVKASSSGESAHLIPAAIPWGASSWDWDWHWSATPADWVMYAVGISIDGPCGLPHK